MSEPTGHIDTYVRDRLPPEELWPEMDYAALPELAAYPPRLNAGAELIDRMVEEGFGSNLTASGRGP